ncbi:hypothetical protein PR048_012832 [Dryococelus australis]|uniref:Uncharacterized protein n=1 Tax=Dryococelus australis TaxID=614101 RepID=A0ABQ9HQH3_9NEOP|nr:hypothetical protein PR048_012832 [Dryococelus australis]
MHNQAQRTQTPQLKKTQEMQKLTRTFRGRNKHNATPAIITETGIKYASEDKANSIADILVKTIFTK